MGRRLMETHGPLSPAGAWPWFVAPSLVFLGAAVLAGFLERPVAVAALVRGPGGPRGAPCV